MEIEFIGFIRPDLKFRSMEALVAQMADDCAKAKDILNRVADSPPAGTLKQTPSEA
jgi:hypothetical protein